jgi:hypothetical protein
MRPSDESGDSADGRNQSHPMAGEVVFIFADHSVDRKWLRDLLADAGDLAVVEVSADFLFGLPDGISRLKPLRGAARRHGEAAKELDHAWYGIQQAAIRKFREKMVEALEDYLFRHAKQGNMTVALCTGCQFDSPRLPDTVGLIVNEWPDLRIVLATGDEVRSVADRQDALGTLLMAARNRAETWFTGGMERETALEFLRNWLSRRSA